MPQKYFYRLAFALMATIFYFHASPVSALGKACLSRNIYCPQDGDGKEGMAQESEKSDYSENGQISQSNFGSNPSRIPVAKGLGVTAVYYKVRPDFIFVSGTGRIGAAISPGNGDDTFFGNPSFESEDEYLQRHLESRPYPKKKIVLGAATSLIDNGGKGFTRFQLTVGALGRYNSETKSIKPGGGISITAGPLVLRAAVTEDETRQAAAGNDPPRLVKDTASELSAGLTLGSLMLDYSRLKLSPDSGSDVNVELMTAGLLLRRWIFTGAYRIEKSERLAFDSDGRSLIVKPVKEDVFGGVQFSICPHFQVGVFYNYYLLKETSAGLTVFL